jgi:hypothetical protein
MSIIRCLRRSRPYLAAGSVNRYSVPDSTDGLVRRCVKAAPGYAQRSLRPEGGARARDMLAALILSCALAAAAAAPVTYDQRQDGDLNVRADVQNVVLLVALPQKMSLPGGIPSSLLEGLFKEVKPSSDIQERADVRVMEAFVEPNTPYKVEIGSSGRDADADGRAVEVVIAGRRRQGVEVAAEAEELKLLGATEQCGPDRERDPVTLSCRARIAPADDQLEDTIQPEVVPAS